MIDRTILVEKFGGKCERCAYNECQRALHFHHRNGREGKTSGKVDLQEVADFPERFQLLCANCHIWTHDQLDRARHVIRTCEFCGKQFRLIHYSTSREGRGRFCSRRCQHDARSATARTIERVLERIDSYIERRNDCLIWTGNLAGNNYTPIINAYDEKGVFHPLSVRRVLYEATHGKDATPKRLYASCGNKLCVSPEHATSSRQRY
jgi:hypothetical protein